MDFGAPHSKRVLIFFYDDGIAWSAPSSMSPNNLSAGLMFGVDIYDAVLSPSLLSLSS